MSPGRRTIRRMLLAPAFVSRAAARAAGAREEAWMLRQPRPVRESYVREVVDRGEDALHAEIWMLRQPNAVRESYAREVLEPALSD
ncbi:MAG: hypothetical protein ACXVRH_01110 [Thermoleophilaceae bacterium]